MIIKLINWKHWTHYIRQ